MNYTNIIETSYGKIRGIQEDGRQVFKGIRYAIAKRFQKPVLTVSDQEVYDATAFGYTCPQPGQPEGSFYDREFWHHKEYSTPMNEDCLFLNIWRPDHAENCPVAIWIHGGAYMNGFGSKVEIDGEFWNKQGIILVSINYRVGVSGFLTSRLLDEAYGDSGNLGIYDQLAAVEWVHRHIASFGGNPEHITIMGQSAGAMSVQTLLGAPGLNKGVVGAVMQSGGGINNWMNVSVPKAELQVLHDEFLSKQGITTVEELMAADMMELVWAGTRFANEKKGNMLLFIPYMSEDILPDTYENLAMKGQVRDVPCLIGCTANDITVNGEDTINSPVYKGCLNWASALHDAEHAPNYVYVFQRKPLGGEGQGAFHSSDLWYSFHTLDRSWRVKDARDYAAADEMCARWTAFIKNGDPNAEGYPKWNAYKDEGDVYYIG